MQFRLQCPIPDLLIDSDDELTVEVGGEHELCVRVQTEKHDEARGSMERPNCVATGTWRLDEGHLRTLATVARGEDPKGAYRTKDGTLTLTGFAPEFAEVLTSVRRTLWEASQRVVSLLRWRHNVMGPNAPLLGWRLHFAGDGAEWARAPAEYTTRLVPRPVIQDFVYAPRDVEGLAAAGGAEPLYWEMLREARNLAEESPRSALLTAVAAMETGVKATVAALAPNAEWLIRELPSPPLVRLIWEYLPKLRADQGVGGKVVVPPNEPYAAFVRKAVHVRNQLVHVGRKAPPQVFVIAVLAVAQDVLAYMDRAQGHAWAEQHAHTANTQFLIEQATRRQG